MTRDIHIDRLVLTVPGLDEAAGRRLAELVGRHLAAADTNAEGYVPRLSLVLDGPQYDLDQLARRIASAVLTSKES
jgi:hypothetical protein